MAAPTSNNEVTARRLTRLLTGSDGNGGLWGKIKTLVGEKQSKYDCSTYCTGTAGWFKVASVPAQITNSNINAIFEVLTHSNASPTYGTLYINVRTNSAGALPGATTFQYVKNTKSDLGFTNAKIRTVGTGKDVTVELWINPGTYRAVTLSLNKSTSDLYSRDFVWTFYSGEATSAEPTADAANNIQVFPVTKQSTTDASWINSGSFGNITSGGALQTNDITIANGDKLVVTDASDSNKVARTSATFDGSTVGTLLSKKGTFENPREAYLAWGGKNWVGNFGPLDAALVSELGANRLAGGNANGITIEYTRDGGTTWIDYGASNTSKRGLFTRSASIVVGKADSNNKATSDANYANYKVRVIIDCSAFGIYNEFQKFVFYVSTNGSSSCYMVMSGIARAETSDVWTNIGEMQLNGWSGYNVYNKTVSIGSANSYATYKKLCFLFECRATGSNKDYNGLAILSIYGYGGVGWTTPSTFASTGHLYNYDGDLNATFPATVSAVNFKGILKRELAGSGTIAESVLLQATGSTDQFNITYECAESNKAIVRMYTADDGDETISIGNKVSSTYKEAISVTNGSATITGSLTGPATKLGTANLGSTTKPIYLVGGVATECSTYAGGTAVTLNGTSKSATTASFYAPTGAGTSGQLLKSSGSGAPTWATANAALVGITVTSTSVSDGTTTFNKYTHPTSSGNKHVPSGGSSGQFLGWSADGTAAWVANPNTDTKVTSSANHYTPATASGSDKTASASGATAAWSIDVVKGVTLNTDGKGHVTGLSVTSGKIPANPNTDTKVKATAKTDNVEYKILATASASPTSGNATEAVYDADITLNPSTNTIAANISGNAATATTATTLGSSTLGSGTKPIYLSSGTATECSTYAGGTAVTLNNASKAASTASFYAPTAGGTANYVLIGNGTTSAPTWAEKAPKATTADKASVLIGTYSGSGGALAPSSITQATVRAVMMNKPLGLAAFNTYCDCILMDTYNGSDVPYVTGFGISKNSGNPKMYIFNGAKGNTTTWAHELEVLTTASTIDAANVSGTVAAATTAGTATKPVSTLINSSNNLASILGSSQGDVLTYHWTAQSPPTGADAITGTGTAPTAMMQVYKTHSGNYSTQLVYTADKGIFTRYYNGGTWTSWEKLNSDEKVKQTNTTAVSDYRVLLSPTTSESETINGTLKSENFWARPSDGTFRATKFNVAGGCTMQYNSSTLSVDFVF